MRYTLLAVMLVACTTANPNASLDAAIGDSAEPTGGAEWDLGAGLVLQSILGLSIAYYEASAGVCEHPNTFSVGYQDPEVDPRLDLLGYFEGTEPTAIDLATELSSANGDNGESTFRTSIGLRADGRSYPAMEGSGTVAVDKAEGSVAISLSDLAFRDHEGVFDGKTTLDVVGVGCFSLAGGTEGGDGGAAGDCGWVREPVDTANAFCTGARAGYAADALN